MTSSSFGSACVRGKHVPPFKDITHTHTHSTYSHTSVGFHSASLSFTNYSKINIIAIIFKRNYNSALVCRSLHTCTYYTTLPTRHTATATIRTEAGSESQAITLKCKGQKTLGQIIGTSTKKQHGTNFNRWELN